MSVYRTPLMESKEVEGLDIATKQLDQDTQTNRRHSAQTDSRDSASLEGGMSPSAYSEGGLLPSMLELDSPKIDITDMNAHTAGLLMGYDDYGLPNYGTTDHDALSYTLPEHDALSYELPEHEALNYMLPEHEALYYQLPGYNLPEYYPQRYYPQGYYPPGRGGISIKKIQKGAVIRSTEAKNMRTNVIWENKRDASEIPHEGGRIWNVYELTEVDWWGHGQGKVVREYHEFPFYKVKQNGSYAILPSINKENASNFMSLRYHENLIVDLLVVAHGTLDHSYTDSRDIIPPLTTIDLTSMLGNWKIKNVCLARWAWAETEFITTLMTTVYKWYDPLRRTKIEIEHSNNVLSIYNYSPFYAAINIDLYLEWEDEL